MSLYTTGTVNMTNGSNAVVGVGTAALANISPGDGFLVAGENVYYTVLSVTDDTHWSISANYAGATGTGKSYQVSRDWTINLGLAEIQPGDPNWPFLLAQSVIRKLDTLVATGHNIPNNLAWTIKNAENGIIVKIDEATGNVGIGMSVPQALLHVKSTSGFTPQVVLGQQSGYRLDLGYNNSSEYGFLQAYAVDTSTYDDIVINPLGGKVGIGTTSPTSKLHVVGLPVYANNAAAIAGGLTAGAFYRTGGDPDPVCVVH